MDNRRRLEERKAYLLSKISSGDLSKGIIDYAIRIELPRVEGAFQRLADGTYGQCIVCGEVIPEARLERMPEIHTCKKCEPDEKSLRQMR